jgi:hypothetical protein
MKYVFKSHSVSSQHRNIQIFKNTVSGHIIMILHHIYVLVTQTMSLNHIYDLETHLCGVIRYKLK